MKRFIESYDGEEFDLIVIGGGITGATTAYEASSRGLKVALVEKYDFASATSSATSKMIHGGLRYLSTYEFGLVRESLKERRVLMNIATNFIHPASFLFSVYKKDKVSNSIMKIAMILYELFSFDKNWLWDKSKKMPSYKSLSAKKIKKLFPNAVRKELIGGQMYYDCSSHSPERLTLAFIKSAIKHGASVSNYTRVQDFIVNSDKKTKHINGVKVIDEISKKTHDIYSKLVINCSGPWADILLDKVKKGIENHELRRSEGIHIITKKIVENHIFSGSAPSGKHFFLVPYRNHTLIGTTDKEFLGKPDDYKVTRESIEELLVDVNASFGENEKIEYKDIIYAYGGLRPLVEDQTEDSYDSSRKYEITGEKKNGIEGLITVEGGKFTTSRMLAEKAIDKALNILNISHKHSISESKKLYISDIDNFSDFVKVKHKEYPKFNFEEIEFLAKSYGTELDELFALANVNSDLLKPLNDDGECLAQVVFSIRNEMALTLEDIMLRRTGIAQLGNPGKEVINKVAEIASKELNWNNEKIAEEISKLEMTLKIPE
ncbi:MAG: glycerol-3-phosphate dehydrogenase/oxidase [Flavobacteriales bacterium]|nr:glycerol-3-phosphate dehydrogenase/oxidase [Flavobacteriales bacterium]